MVPFAICIHRKLIKNDFIIMSFYYKYSSLSKKIVWLLSFQKMTGYAFEPIQLRNKVFDGKKEQKKTLKKLDLNCLKSVSI